MRTGWLKDGSKWYYLGASGAMKSGWLNYNGTWYYLDNSGAMKTGWLKDGDTWYYLDASGVMKSGWLNDNGTWYYLDKSGAMLENYVVDNYYLGNDGVWRGEGFSIKIDGDELVAYPDLKIKYEVTNNTNLQLDLIPEYKFQKYVDGKWENVKLKTIKPSNDDDKPKKEEPVVKRDTLLEHETMTGYIDLAYYDEFISQGTYRIVRDYELPGYWYRGGNTSAKKTGSLIAEVSLLEPLYPDNFDGSEE